MAQPELTFRLEGLRGVMDTLRQLPPELTSRRGGIIRAAVRKAALPVLEQARANVRAIVAQPNIGGKPSDSTGALENAIGLLRFSPGGGDGGEAISVGIGKLKRKFADTIKNRRAGKVGKEYEVLPPTYYAWFLELGTEKMQAHPFMEPAYLSKRNEATSILVTEIQRGIERALKKLKRMNKVKESTRAA